MAASDELLRSAGLSRNKMLAIRDLAAKTLDGTVPTVQQAHRMSDDELIERLIAVRGIGRWTVEMLLIFRLGRPDVLPVDDYGVRKGFAKMKKMAELPKPKELAAYGEKWKPHRSVAAWYLWRAAEMKDLPFAGDVGEKGGEGRRSLAREGPQRKHESAAAKKIGFPVKRKGLGAIDSGADLTPPLLMTPFEPRVCGRSRLKFAASYSQLPTSATTFVRLPLRRLLQEAYKACAASRSSPPICDGMIAGRSWDTPSVRRRRSPRCSAATSARYCRFGIVRRIQHDQVDVLIAVRLLLQHLLVVPGFAFHHDRTARLQLRARCPGNPECGGRVRYRKEN